MGNFSRDPSTRLSDARGKHHVAVRLQQGVPILDADWNTLDDLRRVEAEEYGRWSVGDGVPFGNDGFRILPIAGGGVGTLVLSAAVTDSLLSSLRVNVVTSTAAAALGFDGSNEYAERSGSSLAQLTGNTSAPFALTDGSTLVVTVNEATPGAVAETITFHAANFANIAAATGAEVIAVIAATATRVSGLVGAGNDFIIRGGDGTTENAGRIVVRGRAALNESDLKYTAQPLFQNSALATQWSVSPVPALTNSNEAHFAFLDLWDREVDSGEDKALVDDRIGVETAVRLRREWAVRVTREVDYPATAAAAPPGHVYYPLSRITRGGNGSPVTADAIVDLRDTDLSVRRGVSYRNASGIVLVDTLAFRQLLADVRDTFRDFITFLTTKFVTPDSVYAAGEVAGIQALDAVARIAEQGTALIGARSVDTTGAVELMDELRGAQVRLVAVWTTGVLPIVKGSGKIYDAAFATTIAQVNALLMGPTPVGFVPLTQAVQAKNLFDALRAQQQIDSLFIGESNRPTGFLIVSYLGSTTTTITRNQALDLRFRVTGSINPQDTLLPEITIGNGWSTSLKNGDGTVPFNALFGPGNGTQEFIVTVQPPNTAVAETDLSIRVSATHNSNLYQFIAPKHLKIGDPPPPSEQDFSFRIAQSTVQPVGAQFQVPTSATGSFDFVFKNNTNGSVDVAFTGTPASSGVWGIFQNSIATPITVPGKTESQQLHYDFVAPSAAGSTLSFTFQATNNVTSALLASITINLIAV